MRSIRLYLGLLCCLLLWSCNDEELLSNQSHHTDVYKVAVIAPSELLPYWQRSAQWAQEILHRAQIGMKNNIRVELVYYNENDKDIDAHIERVAKDEGIAAIIGPVSPEKASIAAHTCRSLKKTLILPITSNAEFQRIYSTLDHVFNLTQNDIIQMEAMLATLNEAMLPGFNNYVGLITSDDKYGETFYDWFGFLATERNYETPFISKTGNTTSIADAVKLHYSAMKNDKIMQHIFFAPSDARDLLKAKEEFEKMEAFHKESGNKWTYIIPELICSDACVNEEIAQILQNGYEGIEATANPASGFTAAYEAKFGEHPRRGEAQLFDAVYLIYYSLKAMQVDERKIVEEITDSYGKSSRHSPLWEYFVKMVDGDKSYSYNWFDYSVQLVFNSLEEGMPVSITGVSSTLEFDKKHHCAVTSTTYRHWKLHNGRYETLQYFSADGSDRTISTINNWTFNAHNKQLLELYDTHIEYPEHKGNYAVIVAASSGWTNYRHQADALAMYKALLAQGFDDNNIILILEDDIAHHERNLYPGEVKITPNGKNLYDDIVADYRMSSLYPADIVNILTGVETARTPIVLESTENDNVFFFWSGHGESNSLIYNEHEFTSSEVRKMLEAMKEQKKFRKLFCVMEACFSGSVAKACEGIEGVLMLTAANESETSKADMYDDDLGVYLSNGFTRAFQTKILEAPNSTLRDLFYYVVTQTVGSHASLYNYKNYGNIYTEHLSEMLYKSKSVP